MANIKEVVSKNLCIECGICTAICPSRCIEFKKELHNYKPKVSDSCTNCGLCRKTCPINNITDYDLSKNFEDNVFGYYRKILSVKSKDKLLLANAASGGAITQIITDLLKDEYDCAFLVDGYEYENQLQTKYFDKNSDLSTTQKSRYLTVCHANTCNYMLQNPDKKVIIVATGCVISGILNFIKIKKLKRENYLLLGLFCDKTMNMGVIEYFKNHALVRGGGRREFTLQKQTCRRLARECQN